MPTSLHKALEKSLLNLNQAASVWGGGHRMEGVELMETVQNEKCVLPDSHDKDVTNFKSFLKTPHSDNSEEKSQSSFL